jgi:hypothetical protein
MCSVVILYRPGHRWPVLLGANRDEMAGRPWAAPARHWPDRPEVVAGLDEKAGGTWLGLSDYGLAAAVLNRPGTLGPESGKRSRGELPLEALDHPGAEDAAEALSQLETTSYRPFNMLIADRREAFWLSATGDGRPVRAEPIPPGMHMLTAHDLNDTRSGRIRAYLPRFRDAAPPDPEANGGAGDWKAWQSLLASHEHDSESGPRGAMSIATEGGFGTVSSSLVALPAPDWTEGRAKWLFAGGKPDETPYEPVDLGP